MHNRIRTFHAAIAAAILLGGCATTFRTILPGPVSDMLRAPITPQRIRVAIALSKPSVTVKVVGPGMLYDKTHHRRLRRFSSLGRAVFRAEGGRIVINGRPTSAERVLIVPDMPQTLWVDSVLYRGKVEVIASGQRTLTAVNTLSLEEYLMGVVPKETFASWPEAALRVQAIAARTFAVYHMRHNSNNDHDIEAPRHQLYGGAGAEDPRTTKAILDTEGEILTYRGDVLCTFFYTCCGGRTEEARNVFPKIEAYPHAVKSPYCKGSRHYSWTYSVALVNCEEKLRRDGRDPGGPIVAVRVIERFKSGRVARIRFSSRARSVDLTGEECRRILGYDKVRSTLFKVRVRGGRLQFVGRGWGHGVGMCQWCSERMAERGMSYEEILTHFYPGTRLQR